MDTANILIVEDDVDINRLLCTILEGAGYTCRAAFSGSEALLWAEKYGYETVNVVPQPKAGGSFASAAWKYLREPAAVEHIKADAGIDIGDTLIGMHLKDVAVPVRIDIKKIGEAHVVCARTRAKFIGGERAVYNEALL